MMTVNDFLKKNKIARFLRGLDSTPLLLCWATAVFYAFFCYYLGKSPTGHSGYYTYTLQALAWRNGQVSLGRDYPWLELAVFNGDWYVSFPPVPSVPLYFLTFIFGFSTPDNLLVKLYVLIGCLSVYHLLRKAGYDKPAAAAFALLCSFASCLLTLTTDGAVWYQAQTLAFCLTCGALCAMWRKRPTLSLLLYALAVGCRPFNALYGLLLFALYADQCSQAGRTLRSSILRLLPGLALGFCVACAYGWYNYIRFGNIFEFGHNYLPEFSTQGGIQFSLSHIPKNIKNFFFRMPFSLEEGGWTLQRFGFCFLIANPVLLMLLIWIISDLIHKRFTWLKGLILGLFLLHLFLLLMHRTFGGLQFGARYTCDLLPYAALYLALPGRRRSVHGGDIAALLFAMIFSIFGAASILL